MFDLLFAGISPAIAVIYFILYMKVMALIWSDKSNRAYVRRSDAADLDLSVYEKMTASMAGPLVLKASEEFINHALRARDLLRSFANLISSIGVFFTVLGIMGFSAYEGIGSAGQRELSHALHLAMVTSALSLLLVVPVMLYLIMSKNGEKKVRNIVNHKVVSFALRFATKESHHG